jgi:hypothetical protein
MYYFCGIGGKNKRHAMTQFILLCCLALLVCVTIYGLIFYRGAPIRKRSDGIYRDKGGRVFTERQFHAFKIWELCFAGSLGLVVVAGVAGHFATESPIGSSDQ